jgi:shikimate kinase
MAREAAQGVMFESTGEAREDDRRSLVLVGLMGAGKSTVGRRLAQRLNLRFVDADDEIEAAAGMTIPEIFDRYGEAHFRDGERRVIRRLLSEPRQVIATGGGAFMNDETRALIAAEATSIWLKADLDTLVRRCAKRTDRPLLRGRNQRETLAALMQQRYPVYETSDLVVESGGDTHDVVVNRIISALGKPVDSTDNTVQQ